MITKRKPSNGVTSGVASRSSSCLTPALISRLRDLLVALVGRPLHDARSDHLADTVDRSERLNIRLEHLALSDPKCVASSVATSPPTWRMPKPVSSGCQPTLLARLDGLE